MSRGGSPEKQFVLVSENGTDDATELPVEHDNSLLLSTLTGQYPGSSGLKYKTPEMRAYRGLRIDEGKIYAPADGWGDHVYLVVFPKQSIGKPENAKRKMVGGDYEEGEWGASGAGGPGAAGTASKFKRVDERRRCMDLIVLGLDYSTSEERLRDYFSRYGNLLVAEIKRDGEGKSKGYGFIRFDDYEAQVAAMSHRHEIDGRQCDAKIPNSKIDSTNESSRKVFVGRVPSSIRTEDLREYFSQFGEVTDIYIPNPYRAFAFVSFMDPQVARSLQGQEHVIRGHSVSVGEATPKGEKSKESQLEAHIAQQTAFWGPGGPETYGAGGPGKPSSDSRHPDGGPAPMPPTSTGGWYSGTPPSLLMTRAPMPMSSGGYNPALYPPPPPPNGFAAPPALPPRALAAGATSQATYGMGNLNLGVPAAPAPHPQQHGGGPPGGAVNPQIYAAAHAALVSAIQNAGGGNNSPGPVGSRIKQENPISKTPEISPTGGVPPPDFDPLPYWPRP